MQDERTLERLGALAGLAFVVLTLLATFLYPQQPRIDAAPATTLAWVHNHRAALEAGMILGIFGAGFFLWFAAHLRTVLKTERLGNLVYGSGIGVAVFGALGALPVGLLCLMDAQGGIQNGDVVRMLGASTQVLYAAGVIMTLVFVASAGAAMLRRELVTPWLGWVAMAVAVLNGIAIVTSMTFATYHGPGWAVPGWGAYLGFIFVVLVTSVSLARAPEATASRPSAMAAA
ncbi:MAG TPA: hypothetical protein VMU14_07700 [Acidimicrobiales bacterium]|nr:hypothetical protein [Acidimicrobiales bacterium]